jgi:uncharacterized protein YceK
MWLDTNNTVKKLTRLILTVVLCTVLVLAGCSSASNSSSDTAAYSGGSAGGTSSSNAAQSTTTNQAAATDSGGTAGFEAAAESINRMLIYTAYVVMEVDDFAAAQAEIRNLTQLSGGYLLEFSESRSESERSGSFVIKVPSGGFMSFLERLEELSPDRFRSNITGEDVTEEYVDLEARLHALSVTELRLLSFMEKATTAGELVEFSRELSKVQQDIERIKGRMRYLDQNVAYSTVEVRIYELEDGISRIQRKQAPFGERLSTSLRMVLNGISDFLQELAIFVISAIPVAVVIGVFASPFVWLWYRHRRKQRETEEEWAARLQSRGPAALPPKTGAEATEATQVKGEQTEEPSSNGSGRAHDTSGETDQTETESNRNGNKE